MNNVKLMHDLTDCAIADVTSYLLDNTDPTQGFEAIPELDSVRSALQDLQGILPKEEQGLSPADLRKQKIHIASERNTLEEVLETAIASVTQANRAAVVTALMVYHNTLLETLAQALEQAADEAEPESDADQKSRANVKLTYTVAHPMDYLAQLLGAIPSYFNGGIESGDTLKDMVTKGYARTAGAPANWHEQPEASLAPNGSYAFPGDPILTPLLTVEACGQCFYLYDYGLAAYRDSPGCTPEFCRLD